MAYLAPSILAADLLHLEEQIKIVEQHGADYIHIDVMDGHFVPNLTFGPVIVETVHKITSLPLDVHLMMTRPQDFIVQFAKAGSSIITVHQEACVHLDRVIQHIKDHGCKTGVSVNPATPVNTLENVLGVVDLVLIMSVNPGFGGQNFIPYVLEKISQLNERRRTRNFSFLIEVDGGIDSTNAPQVLQAGADILVAGNSIFKQTSIAEACLEITRIAHNIVP